MTDDLRERIARAIGDAANPTQVGFGVVSIENAIDAVIAELGPLMDEKHEKRLAAARRYASWHLREWEWADWIIDAYLNPEEAERALDMEEQV